mgnify:CR=1 FL=1
MLFYITTNIFWRLKGKMKQELFYCRRIKIKVIISTYIDFYVEKPYLVYRKHSLVETLLELVRNILVPMLK